MITYKNFHPEVCKILNMIESCKVPAEVRANLITGPGYEHETEEQQTLRREKARATADAYAFCQHLLMQANIPGPCHEWTPKLGE